MAGRGNPSFLKNQKAQKRVARATAKRAERQARRAERAAARADSQVAGEQPPPVDGEIPEGDASSDGGQGGPDTP